MAGTTDTSSYIYRPGQTPVTRTAISTRAKVFSFDAGSADASLTQIGVISEFSPQHSRGVETRRGIGFGDKIAELIPQNADAVTISVTRTMLYTSNIMQAFGYKAGTSGLVRSLAHHRYPFDIRHELIIPLTIVNDKTASSVAASTSINSSENVNSGVFNDSGEKAIASVFEACWFNDYGISYSVDDVVLTETATLTVSDIYDPGNIDKYDDAGFGSGGNADGSAVPFTDRFSSSNS